jgi:hypothetical protein
VTCILCGSPADGRLRVAVWEEEEKGRLGAHAVILCADCHRKFLAGEITRAEIARAYHKAKGYEPRGWIGRIDRDFLLDIACLECGVLLPVTGQPGELRSPSCGTTNRFARRGDHWLTAEALT